jgi:hypothetical protein
LGDGLLLGIEEVIDLSGQGPDLVRESFAEARRLAGSDSRQASADRVEGPQADADLDPGGSNQHGCQERQGQGRNEIGSESQAGSMNFSTVDGHDRADRSTPEARRQRDPALDGQERGAAWTENRMLVDLRGSRHVGRQRQPRIP